LFLDEATFLVRAGSGGDGFVSFRHEKYAPRGGPDGGDGGNGGSVFLKADGQLSTLTDVARRSVYSARSGKKGRGADRAGAKGADLEVSVPPGTVVREIVADREPREGPILGELLFDGQRLRVARGGRGGRGNKAFATSTRQAPRFAEDGEPGEERRVYLELKLLADAGLIGSPNAGKSTLLSRVSAATPKIADYPFTTLHPNLGLAELGDYRRLVIADIPGLIEGAHQGRGLGHEFLRHIERTRVLAHLVSVEPALDLEFAGKQGEAAEVLAASYRTVEEELSRYSMPLAGKDRLAVLTKIDLLPPASRRSLASAFSRAIGQPVWAISGVTGEGLPELLRALEERVAALR